jgi:hypothetical protein
VRQLVQREQISMLPPVACAAPQGREGARHDREARRRSDRPSSVAALNVEIAKVNATDCPSKVQQSLAPATHKILSPGCGASAAKARRPSGASCSSNSSRTSDHAPTRTSSWCSAGRGLI